MPLNANDSSHSQPQPDQGPLEEQYRSIFENAPDGMFQTSSDGRYLRVNPALARIYGYKSSTDLLTAQPNASGHLYIDSNRRAEFVELMAKQDVINDFESQIYQRDGSVIWISESCRAVRDAQGTVLYYEGFVRDISDRKRSEAERQRAEAKLQESEARNRAIVSAIPDLIMRISRDGFYLDYIPAKDVISLYSREEAIGQHISSKLDSEAVQQRLALIEQVLTTGQPQTFEQQLEVAGILRDFEGRVVVSGEDEVLVIMRDVSDRKQAERELLRKHQELVDTLEQLRHAKQSAEVANHAKSAFLANMSHELRTPLNGILGYTQILNRDKTLSPKQQTGIRTIHQCGSHLLTLINDILDLSKIEAQKIELNAQSFHLAAFLEDLADICRIRAEQKRLNFIFETEGALPDVIQADEKRLRQILFNLLSNAVKFTDSGSVMFRVVGDREGGEGRGDGGDGEGAEVYTLYFEIRDTGVGIALEQLERIFQPFEQVGEYSRRAEGTGLGLTITQKLVALMGGELKVESTLGAGSRFCFAIELPGEWGAIAPALPASSQNIIGYEGPRRTVLVVDDRADNRAVVLGLLEALDFRLIEACDGVEGIEKATAFHPDLIIADLVMPVMDGFEMTRRLRSLEDFQETPIIASSASVFEFDRQKSQLAGYDDFLPKPIQTDELLHKLAMYLKLSWIQDEPLEVAIAPPASDAEIILPPATELVNLYEAAQIGHIERVIQEATRLQSLNADYAPFSARILALADQFDDVAIIQLIEPHLHPS